jgi:hypothetical protein
MSRSTPKGVSRYLDRTPPGPGPQPGNFHTLAHGANCDRLVLPDAEALARWAVEEYPHLAGYPDAVLRWAVAEIRWRRIEAWLEKNGEFDSKARIRPAVEVSRKWQQRAETAASRLGLDPVSYAALKLDVAETARIATRLAQEDLEEGRRLVDARRQQLEAAGS